MNKQQLANKIWSAANKMRSKIEANEYKDYILGLIFYKFLSDTEERCLKEQLGLEEEDFAELVEDFDNPDMASLIAECQKRVGYYIEYKYLFNTWLKTNDFTVATLSDALKSFSRLMNKDFDAVYKDIFKTLEGGLSKLGGNAADQTKALKDLIRLIKDIPTDGRQDYDMLGYVYEYLISNFAANAGKKAGEFYTPHEVAMVMSEIVAEHHRNKERIEIYDPTSGSGSLLITIGKAVSRHISGKNAIKYYAQELKENTYNLTRMNLVMRGILPQNIVTRCADTLEQDWPVHEAGEEIAKPLAVDAVVSNPPYSQPWDNVDKENDPRFANYGLAPKTKADYAFLLHELHHLKADGILTIVLPHGVLFRGKAPKIYDADGNLLSVEEREEGQAEGQIRANLIEKNNIDAIIGLPANIFFGTGIPTLIMVLKKQKRTDDGVLIIDASKGFIKDGKQNKLRACDIKKIADTYRNRASIAGYSRLVSRDEIRRNDYNLNIPRYVDSSEAAERFDVYATMYGGIPNSEIDDLAAYWEAFPTLRGELFAEATDKPYSLLKSEQVLDTIMSNSGVQRYLAEYAEGHESLRQLLRSRLIDHVETVHEMAAHDEIASNILARASRVPLVDKYAAYQILAERWGGIMGDIEIIQSEGIGACNVVEASYTMKKDKNGNESEVFDCMKGRIIPFALVQSEFLSLSLEQLDTARMRMQGRIDDLADIVNSLEAEEQEALLNDDNTAVDKAKVKTKMEEIIAALAFKGAAGKKKEQFLQTTFDADSFEAKVQSIVLLQDEIATLNKDIKQLSKRLEEETIATIEQLDMKAINHMLEQKWVAPITEAIAALPYTILAQFAERVKGISSKYATTFMEIESELRESDNNLAQLARQLAGDEYAIAALTNLFGKEG